MWQTKADSDQQKSKLWMPCTWSHFRSLTSGCDIFRLSRLGPCALGHHAHIKYLTTNLTRIINKHKHRTPKHRGMIQSYTVICLPFFLNTILEPGTLRDNLLTPSGIKSDWSFKRKVSKSDLSCFRICINFSFDRSFFSKNLIKSLTLSSMKRLEVTCPCQCDGATKNGQTKTL